MFETRCQLQLKPSLRLKQKNHPFFNLKSRPIAFRERADPAVLGMFLSVSL
jgi:hypothetical protein